MTHMTHRASLVAATLLSVSLALPSWAEGETETAAAEAPEVNASTVVATVNGEEITLGHVVAARDDLPAQYQQLPADVLFPGLIDQLVQQTVLSQAVDKVSDIVELRLENQRRSLVASIAIEDVIADAVSEEELQAAYDELVANIEPTVEWNASHILVETEEEAAALVEEAKADDADFAALAKEHSTGPSGPNGGELGWFSDGMMVEPFQVAVADMEAGDVAGPIQTQFGWHVIKLNDKRMAGAPALEEVRPELEAELQNKAFEAALEAMMETATIDRADVSGIPATVLTDPAFFE